MAKPHAYSDAESGPIQAAFLMRLDGLSWPDIVARLKADRDDCGSLTDETARRWGQRGSLRWDTIVDLVAEHRAEHMPAAARPESAERLSQVRELIMKCTALFGGAGDEGFAKRLETYGVRPDTFLLKLYDEERRLTHSDLLGIPRRAIQRVILLVMRELVSVLVERNLVSSDRIRGEADEVERAIMKRMPGVLNQAAAEEAVSA